MNTQRFPLTVGAFLEGMKAGRNPAYSFIEHNEFCVAQNYKVFSSEVARAIFKQRRATDHAPTRPQFLLHAGNVPQKTVALLVGDPVAKFISACTEDGITPEQALMEIEQRSYPSMHFLPQTRYLHAHSQNIVCWKAPDHIPEFWKKLELGDPPTIRPPSSDYSDISDSIKSQISKIYADDVLLFNSIDKAETAYDPSREQPPSIAKMMQTFIASGITFMRRGGPLASPQLLAEREAICRACSEWDASGFRGSGRCRKCGCSTWAKLRMATEKCPIGKW